MDQYEETKLIKLAKSGSDEAFTKLFRSNYLFLYKYLMKLTLQQDVTEDLVQETMLKAYVHLKSFNGKSKFSTWLISIASRLFIDLLRKERRRKITQDEMKTEAIRKLKWQMSLSGEEWTLPMEIFAGLDPEVRTAILLKHYYDYTYEEIAHMLSVKEGTVNTPKRVATLLGVFTDDGNSESLKRGKINFRW